MQATRPATKQLFPIVAEMKRVVKLMSGENAQKLLISVTKLEAVLSVLHPPRRKLFPKEFTITRKDDQVCLQERIEGSIDAPLYCIGIYYEAIGKAVAVMDERSQEFDRETLIEEARKINPRVTKPAVITCIRFWMSIENPLLEKNTDTNLYAAVTSEGDFLVEALEEWKNVGEKPLILVGPRKIREM